MSRGQATCFSCLLGMVCIPTLLQVLVPTISWPMSCDIIPDRGPIVLLAEHGWALFASGYLACNGRNKVRGFGPIQTLIFVLIGLSPSLKILKTKSTTHSEKRGAESSLRCGSLVAAEMPMQPRAATIMKNELHVLARCSDLATRTVEHA